MDSTVKENIITNTLVPSNVKSNNIKQNLLPKTSMGESLSPAGAGPNKQGIVPQDFLSWNFLAQHDLTL
jgi:hypothetical protein